MTRQELNREKARARRSRKPIVKNICLDYIKQDLWEMQDVAEEIHYFCDSPEGFDILDSALDDDDEVFEFKMAFSILAGEIERMLDDIHAIYISEYFDELFVAAGCADFGGGLFGWDNYEEDYMPIDDTWSAEEIANKRVSRLSKSELLEAVGSCLRIYQSYIGLKCRYDNLKDIMDIIKNNNHGILNVIKDIEMMYESCWEYGFETKQMAQWEKLVGLLPTEFWLQ